MTELKLVREHERALFDQMKMLMSSNNLPLEKLDTAHSIESSVWPINPDQDIKREHSTTTVNPSQVELNQLGILEDLGRTMTIFSDGIRWGTIGNQVTMKEDYRSSPLIEALRKLECGHKEHAEITKWCSELARVFCLYDENNNGSIEKNEYVRMVNDLPMSERSRNILKNEFNNIDIDHNGRITLKEFLFFFLSFPPMRKELNNNFDNNEPYRNLFDLSLWQTLRLSIYRVLTVPDLNLLSKVLFLGDLALTLVPIGMLYGQLINPRTNMRMQPVIWFLVSYFSAEYLLGLLTCKNKIKFLFNGLHILELASFLPWVIYNLVDWSNDRNHSSALEPFLVSDDGAIGFFLLRILRVSRLPDVISCTWLKEDIDIYVQTINLALTSYKPMAFSLFFLIIFLSTLIYAFERGHWNGEIWIRGEETEASPFANFFNCIWYTIVTGTTL